MSDKRKRALYICSETATSVETSSERFDETHDMKTITIDWITFTFKEFDNDARQFLADIATPAPSISAKPRYGYTAARRNTDGTCWMWNNNRPDMGLHVIFSGSSLRGIQQRCGVQPADLLVIAAQLAGRVTRLDIARDAQDEQISLEKIWQKLETGDYSGTSRKVAQMKGLLGGHTIYVGSRTSERFLRLYDKAAETGRLGDDWIRFEVELKGMLARAAAASIVNESSVQGVFDKVALTALRMPECEDYNRFFATGINQVSLPKIEKHSDRELWILRQVVPALRSHLLEHGLSPGLKCVRELFKEIDSIPF